MPAHHMPDGTTVLPDGSAFFVTEIDTAALASDPICWNPYNKVVQDHRDGTVLHDLTNAARKARGLPTPWTPEMCEHEVHLAPVP